VDGESPTTVVHFHARVQLKVYLYSDLWQCSTTNHPTDVLSDHPVVLAASWKSTHKNTLSASGISIL